MLAKALQPFCERFFYSFYQHRDVLYQAVSCIAELDCLSSLAKCANMLEVKCKPTFHGESMVKSDHGEQQSRHVFELIEMSHPQMLFDKNKKATLVPNDTVFDDNVVAMLVTGPNMGGKSTLLR